MAVGIQATPASVNIALGKAALALRAAMQTAVTLAEYVDGLGAGGLETLGFSSGDAAAVLAGAGYMNTVAGVYYGTIQQGGSNGTGATLYDFDNALSGLWGGQ